MPIVAIPRHLREKLGEDASEELVRFVNEATKEARDNVILLAEEKFETRLTEETSRLDKRITEEIAKLDKRITEEIAKLRIDLDKRITELDKRITEEIGKIRIDMASFKAEIIKWMFLFWIGQIAVIAGLLKFIR